jgi:hypothetical protein
MYFSPAGLLRQRSFRLSANFASPVRRRRTWRKAGEPFPSFSRTDGSSFRRLKPVERQFLQTAIQEYVPIVKTTLKPEVRILPFKSGASCAGLFSEENLPPPEFASR